MVFIAFKMESKVLCSVSDCCSHEDKGFGPPTPRDHLTEEHLEQLGHRETWETAASGVVGDYEVGDFGGV